MSSSNIYDKTPFFHPEVLVQSENIKEMGWQSTLIEKEPSKYQAAPILSEENKVKQSLSEKPADREQISAAAPQPDSTEEEKTKDNDDVDEQPLSSFADQEATRSSSIENDEHFQQELEKKYQQGIADGLEQAANDFKTSAQALVNIAEQLNTIREVLLQNSMNEMQDLAITIAEKIIRHSITAQDDTIVTTVEDAIRQAVKSDEFYVCINQDDYDIIQQKAPDIINKISGLENIVIKIDNDIEPGGCMVESDNCTVDATIASQLQIITDQIKNGR